MVIRRQLPCLWRLLPASIAGGAGARPDHSINRHQFLDVGAFFCVLFCSACSFKAVFIALKPELGRRERAAQGTDEEAGELFALC